MSFSPQSVDKIKAKSQKTKKEEGTRRRWTIEENEKLLRHLLTTIRSGKTIEKPNATVYYDAANIALKLDDCKGSTLKNQVKNLKKKYTDAIAWRGQTGQGVLAEEGEESFQRKCFFLNY